MTKHGGWLVRVGALVVTTALVAGNALVPVPVAAQDSDEPPPRNTIVPVTEADLAAVAARLPDDPVEAAMALVGLIFTGEPRAARAAVGELLRRSGIPLVSADGDLVGVPDGIVLEDAVVYIELLAELADAVLAETHYSPQEVAWLLADLGFPEEGEIEPEELLAGLGDWGKGADAPTESRVAGAAVRALSAHRGHVLYPGADIDDVILDPLQTTLLIAHATSMELVPSDVSAFGVSGHAVQAPSFAGGASGPVGGSALCRDLKDLLDAIKGPQAYIQAPLQIPANPLGEHLSDKMEERVHSERVKTNIGRFSKAKDVAEYGAKVLSVILLMLGARIELKHASGGTGPWRTHFRHQAGERDKHLMVEAHAKFDSSLAGKNVGCWSLGGVDLPRGDAMEGFTVVWSLDQHRGRIQEGGRYLVEAGGHASKFTQGEVLGSSGVSRVELYPPRELQEQQGRELWGSVRINVKLDQAELPLNLSNIWDVRGATIDLALDLLKRATLPSASKTARVGYHGSDIFIARGAADIFLFFVSLPVFVDIYSCTGPEGPWRGRGGFGSWNKTVMGDLAAWIAGRELPSDFAMVNERISFLVNPAAAEPQPFPVTSPDPLISGLMSLDLGWLSGSDAGVRPHEGSISRPAGSIELLIGGQSFPFASTTYPIKWVTRDSRCPPARYEY